MSNDADVFKDIRKDYQKQLAEVDYRPLARVLGIEPDAKGAWVRFFGQKYHVSDQGVFDQDGNEPWHGVSVILFKYILLAKGSNGERPSLPTEFDWVSYREFPDAAPYNQGFKDTVENNLVKYFSGDPKGLEAFCQMWEGRDPEMGLSYQLVRKFDALPKLPLLLLFNDADDEFPAQASLLFPDYAADYLDMECLAILGQSMLLGWKKQHERA
ncbi:DUF3786 domain-containing protein [Dethiosulfatarculus sandiegensis]|uniref:DUF3786 domain-containing protein n=1 Tax=Dethiosulfatarculus sandiegensis TaxID=1429043 RepID=A0A0D2HM26_9BACT|nr:DUF3786 domain-containing protein [Dethiosulfatarculus sandiegensis]KIX11658.1 hypothetical protein X474_23290 [Dethiosulfatarculus sandiegensis]